MNQFNLGNFLNKFANQAYQGQPKPAASENVNKSTGAELASGQGNSGLNTSKIIAPPANQHSMNLAMLNNNLKMNLIPNLERSLYIKDLMSLPKDLKEMMLVLQKMTQNAETAKDLKSLLSNNINIANLSELLQKGGKEAMNKLVFAMAEASKQGVNDTSQLKDAIKLINASVSVAGQENPSQVLKNFMLLYLPWLPLQEGVDFELELESSEDSDGESDTTLTIMISTKNYGNIKILLILKGTNTFDIFVTCVENFPKEELLKRIREESRQYSLQTDMTFQKKKDEEEKQTSEDNSRQAKINLSNITEVNPFLLLIANALIRHTIELDNL